MQSLVTFTLLCSVNSQLWAIDVDAGDYDAVPNGVNLAILYYQHASANKLYSDGHSVNGKYGLTSNIGIARYVKYIEKGKILFAPQILIPFGEVQPEHDSKALLGNNASGLGDITLASAFIYTLQNSAIKTIGLTPYLVLPTGKYDKDKFSLSENRLKLIVQGAITSQLSDQISWDNIADITFYGHNDKIAAGGKLKQNMGYQVQTNVRLHLNEMTDLRAGLSYNDFGDVKTNGITTQSNQQTKIWLGVGYKPTTSTQLLMNVGQDLNVKNGFKEQYRLNFRLLKAF